MRSFVIADSNPRNRAGANEGHTRVKSSNNGGAQLLEFFANILRIAIVFKKGLQESRRDRPPCSKAGLTDFRTNLQPV
jgi:hypothetical protein